MSILGVKKKQEDTTELEKKITKINIELQTINSNDKQLYKGINNVTLRVNNNEKMININKNKPDRKIICIYAGIDSPPTSEQMFTFGDGGESFLLPNPGQILSMSLVSLTSEQYGVHATMVLNGMDLHAITSKNSIPHYLEFEKPVKVEAGDILGFKYLGFIPIVTNSLVSVIIELFI